jgi:hypothetical protein
MYLPGRKRALTGKEMAELQEADSGPIQLENDAKHFVIQRFRLKTMLNSNSILQKPLRVKMRLQVSSFLNPYSLMMSFGCLQVQRFLRMQR